MADESSIGKELKKALDVCCAEVQAKNEEVQETEEELSYMAAPAHVLKALKQAPATIQKELGITCKTSRLNLVNREFAFHFLLSHEHYEARFKDLLPSKLEAPDETKLHCI